MFNKSRLELKRGRVLFVVNIPQFFLSHRLPIALKAKALGYDVHVATADDSVVEVIRSQGFTCHTVPFVRNGQNPWRELMTLVCLVSLFLRFKPVLVHLVTIKPVLYGGIAARLAKVPAVVAAVSGLGTVFFPDSRVGRLRRALVVLLYRMAFRHKRLAVIFQNPNDRDTLITASALKKADARLIRGSGVSLSDYPFIEEPEGQPIVVMAARLLRDKGVMEFIEAGRVLNRRGIEAEFRLIGSPDPDNSNSVSEDELNSWSREGVVTLLGFRKDIAAQYAASNIVCLPSYYGEGLPKCLVEAAACGRAVVTTNHPGCRDAITPGVTGLTVPVKDPIALADAIQSLIEDTRFRREMGKAGRKLAEEAFAIEIIVDRHMAIYEELLAK